MDALTDSLKMPKREERQATVRFTCSPLPPTPVLLPAHQEEVERGLNLVLRPADGQCLGRCDGCPEPLREPLIQALCFPAVLLHRTPPPL